MSAAEMDYERFESDQNIDYREEVESVLRETEEFLSGEDIADYLRIDLEYGDNGIESVEDQLDEDMYAEVEDALEIIREDSRNGELEGFARRIGTEPVEELYNIT